MDEIVITGSTGVIGRRAVRELVAAAALRVPAGTYNVADADPPTNAEIDAALAAAVGVGALRPRVPQDGPMARSQRVSSRRLREAGGWAPRLRAGSDGWSRIVA